MIKKVLLFFSFFLLIINISISQCTLTAVCPGGGNWTSAASWTTSGCGAVTTPGNDMTIIIPACATIQITNSINGVTYSNLTILISGNLNFAVGSHLNMSSTSSISVIGSGSITGANAGDQINIGGTNVWTDAPNPISGGTVLPIELLSFQGKINGKKIDLTWTTATEINNDFFTIEKSIDGVALDFVSTADGAGNSSYNIDYVSEDLNPTKGVAYYFLKQTDFNGLSQYVSVISVYYEEYEDFCFNVFPNPNDGSLLNFSMNSEKGREISVSIYDDLGRNLYSKNIYTGEKVYTINTSEKLAPGIYLITVSFQQNICSKKLIVN